MFIKLYMTQAIRALLAGVVVFSGIITFGMGEWFDRIFLTVLIFIIIHAIRIKDIDLTGIILILLLVRAFDELLFILPNFIWVKLIIYGLCLYATYRLHGDKLSIYVVVPLLSLSIIAECYWFMIDYSAPDIYYYNALVTLNLLVRRGIYLRVLFIPKWFGKTSGHVLLAHYIFKIAKAAILTLALVIIEFICRHSTQLNPDLIYFLYPYIQHTLLVGILLFITDHAYKQRFIVNA